MHPLNLPTSDRMKFARYILAALTATLLFGVTYISPAQAQLNRHIAVLAPVESGGGGAWGGGSGETWVPVGQTPTGLPDSSCDKPAHDIRRGQGTKDQINFYLTNCLTTINQLDPEQATALRQLIGVFGYTSTNEGSQKLHPFCTGMILTDKLILTARHCFGFIRDVSTDKYRPKLSGMFFSSLASPTVLVKVIAVLDNPHNVQAHQVNFYEKYDFVLAQTDVAITNVTYGIQMAEAHSKDKLIVYGYNSDAAASVAGSSNWVDAMRADKMNTCAIYSIPDTCIIHGCQTSEAMSGSPILRWDASSKRFDLIGVHSATPGLLAQASSENRCPSISTPLEMVANRGVIVRAQDLVH